MSWISKSTREAIFSPMERVRRNELQTLMRKCVLPDNLTSSKIQIHDVFCDKHVSGAITVNSAFLQLPLDEALDDPSRRQRIFFEYYFVVVDECIWLHEDLAGLMTDT